MIPVSQLGWMAGIIDLKGRVQYKNNKQRKTRQAVLIIDSIQHGVIRQLANMTGTRPEAMEAKPLRDFMRRGCAEHCPENHVHVGDELMMRSHSRWTITGAGMATVIYNVIPFLQIDKGWDEIMSTIITESPLTGRGASAIMAQLHRLNELGWELPERFSKALAEEVTSEVVASDAQVGQVEPSDGASTD